MSEVRVSEEALSDLRRIRAFLAEEAGEEVAANAIEAILKGAELLAQFPELGLEDAYGPEKRQLRRFRIRSYFVYYAAEMVNGISLLRIVHTKRDQRRALGQANQRINR